MTSRIIVGDCRDVLKDLIREGVKVNMCVTSPPYYGLRDYDTASWLGGDPACGHVVGELRLGKNLAESAASTRGGAKKGKTLPGIQARGTCPHCGAVRVDQQIGLEETPQEYVDKMVGIFGLVKQLLTADGTLWLNIGDSYSHGGCGARDKERWPKQSRNDHMKKHAKKKTGLKPKDLIGIPWMLAFALRADGWYLRQDIIWSKPNPMPESVNDRCTKSHEYLFLLSKGRKYYFDNDAIREPHALSSIERLAQDVENQQGSARANGGTRAKRPMKAVIKGGVSKKDYDDRKWEERSDGLARPPMTMKDRDYNPLGRNKRSVWEIATQPYRDAHFATFPPKLVEPCILAGAPPGGVVLDPFSGTGTTGMVALRHGRGYIGIDLSPKYGKMSEKRTRGVQINLLTSSGL